MKYTAENLKVQRVDLAKIEAEFNEQHKDDKFGGEVLNKKYTFHNHQKAFAVVNGYALLVNNEAVGQLFPVESDNKFCIGIFEDLGPGRFAMFPKYDLQFTLDEIKDYLVKDSITLKEHMEDRFDYNSRIQGNTSELLSRLNSKVRKEAEVCK